MKLTLPAQWIAQVPLLDNVWIQAGIVALLSIVLSLLATFIIEGVVHRFTKKTKTKVDDLILEKNKTRIVLLLITLGFQFSLALTPLLAVFNKLLGAISIIVGTAIALSVVNILVQEWGHKLAKRTKTRIDEAILPLLRKAINVVLIITAILAIFRLFNLNITPYLTGLGISGLVIGFALQDSLKNIFGGISLIFDKNFAIGDKVKLESGELGEILEIGIRSTKLRTFNNEVIFVPNGQLANQRIQNYREPSPHVRIVVKFGVAYGTNVDKVKKVVLETIKKNSYYDPEGAYADVIFTAMSDSSISFEARFWVHSWKDEYDARITATEDVYRVLQKNKMEIPYPTRTVHLKK